MLDYAAATTLIVQRLQSTGTADYSVSEIDNALTYALVGIVPADGVPGVTPGMALWPTEEEGIPWTLS